MSRVVRHDAVSNSAYEKSQRANQMRAAVGNGKKNGSSSPVSNRKQAERPSEPNSTRSAQSGCALSGKAEPGQARPDSQTSPEPRIWAGQF